jgi:UDP-N-acetyl-D-mannosaminuronic acid dehydrogenase
VVREHFAKVGLEEGRDVLLANSPNRVMPGRLLERVSQADKLAGGLSPVTPGMVKQIYAEIVREGTVYTTNSLTAEVVKTLENAYRDVRIAYAAEIVRWCDDHDVDFFALRDRVNERLTAGDSASRDAAAVPVGDLLVPTVGVGGHCLPKDGILLRWRLNRDVPATMGESLIHASRRINDASPASTVALAERAFGAVAGKPVAVLGAAYRFDSDDTRNSPALSLARLLIERGCTVRLHDPYVRPHDQNLRRTGLDRVYTLSVDDALDGAALAFVCQPHQPYRAAGAALFRGRKGLAGVVDGCNTWRRADLESVVGYTGIGRGRAEPTAAVVDAVVSGFRAVETGVANELARVIDHLNARYAPTAFERVDPAEVRRLAGTCATGCRIVEPGQVAPPPPLPGGFVPELVRLAAGTKP